MLPTKLSTFQVLALALEFDKALFDHLVREGRLYGYTPQDFHDLVRRGRAHLQEDATQGGRYRFHRKMQQALLASLSRDFGESQGRAVAEIITALFDYHHERLRQALDEAHGWVEAAQHFDRAALLLACHADEGRLDGQTFSACFVRLEADLDSYFNLDSRIRAYRRAIPIYEREFGPEHPKTAGSLNNLAVLLSDMGDYAAAWPLCERSLEIRERVLGPEHPDTVASLSNLASLLRDTGEYAAAGPLHERALAIREAVLGSEHPSTAASLNSLANLLRDMGDYAAARPLYERALAIKEAALGTDHPSTAACLNNLADVLSEMGDYAAARPLYQRALAITEVAFGPEHPRTAGSLNNLADVLSDMGDCAAARPLYERALAIREAMLGRGHPDAARSLSNLANLLGDMGDQARSERLFPPSVTTP